MTRTLVLMRHGKSGYPDGVSDHQRPLAERGIREAALAGDWMRRDGIVVDAVICSTATRTRETLLRTGFADAAVVVYLDDIYGGAPEEILEAIRVHAPADAQTVLVVGHEPGMPSTALYLDPAGDIDRFPTSAYAVVSVATDWASIGLSPSPPARVNGLFIPR
ncbi:histidine phosphatase family protein [Williamsia sp. CHRR-6]|uniref:SixA phosphatase family protein n=1 Tax=Williamsia sp. CHRR-6 TaxID=2835871 RepID=UPI001BDAA669|nr:histidine phosphatase family protein [Williamsia sp. CHRR-6]MBT0565845.1 histidine phosphatase family protein [Williamsia sp. CHRR-6]